MLQAIERNSKEVKRLLIFKYDNMQYHIFLKNKQNTRVPSTKVAPKKHLFLTTFTPQVVQHSGKYPFIHANVQS